MSHEDLCSCSYSALARKSALVIPHKLPPRSLKIRLMILVAFKVWIGLLESSRLLFRNSTSLRFAGSISSDAILMEHLFTPTVVMRQRLNWNYTFCCAQCRTQFWVHNAAHNSEHNAAELSELTRRIWNYLDTTLTISTTSTASFHPSYLPAYLQMIFSTIQTFNRAVSQFLRCF